LAAWVDGNSVIQPASRPAPPRRGASSYAPSGWPATIGGIGAGYNVYSNAGAGPINYASPLATVPTGTTSFVVPSTLTPGTWKFAVRAFNPNGEDKNLTAAVTIVIDANGKDVTNRPAAPLGLRAFPAKAGALRVEWHYPRTSGPKAPAGFHVYCTAGPTLSYAAPAATVAYAAGLFGMFGVNLTGLVAGTAYAIGVRAYNATGEEPNTVAVAATADATGPAAVDSLVSVAVV
jgi:large repetitive protein